MGAPETVLAGRYRLVSVIATGGMGAVWEAWDERLERPVAIKQLHTLPGVPDDEAELAKHRAMREARITARLDHPHAVPVFDAVEHHGQPWLVMQLVPSTPLSAVIRDDGPLPLGRVARIGSEIASALAAAHELGIVHRDVKPGNILITADGGARISDFGISHAMGDATLTHTGMIHGTPAYLAPEAARGEDASFPADVFSLGSTLYAALEGSPPFGSDGNSFALLHKVAAARVPAPTRAGELTPFLLDMLAADPDSRPTMETVARTLTELRADVERDQEPASPPPTALQGPQRAQGAADVESTARQGSEASRQTAPPTARRPEQDAAAVLPWFSSGEPSEVQPAATAASGRAPAGGPPSEGGVDSGSTRSPAAERRRPSRSLLLVGAGAMVALVLLLAATLTDNLRRGPAEAQGGTSVRTTPTPQTQTTQTQTTRAPTSSPTPEKTASPTRTTTKPQVTQQPSRTPERTTTPTTRATVAPASPDRATRLSSAITGYYALLPDDTARAWPRMTADYQTNHAGGRDSYEDFWDDVDDVAVSEVRATPPNRVVATLTYSYSNGRVDVERTSYRLVDEGGLLKIAASEVLSSGPG